MLLGPEHAFLSPFFTVPFPQKAQINVLFATVTVSPHPDRNNKMVLILLPL